MTDRELLEAAAKAAGIRLEAWSDDFECFLDDIGCHWSPLTDDGDAFRLAVALGIDVHLFGSKSADPWTRACVDRLGKCFPEQIADDPCAATRRAIVRAAAAMGA